VSGVHAKMEVTLKICWWWIVEAGSPLPHVQTTGTRRPGDGIRHNPPYRTIVNIRCLLLFSLFWGIVHGMVMAPASRKQSGSLYW